MTDTTPAVALLFDDTELGAQLREALREGGARIVHEGGIASLDRARLQQVGADVLVVNLDDSADDALDHLYELIDGDRPRIVFNDAQASRRLSGWDRARWARHLAVKVLAEGDIDPPRPEDARAIETPPAAEPVEPDLMAVVPAEVQPEAAAVAVEMPDASTVAVVAASTLAAGPEHELMVMEPDFLPHANADDQHETAASAESENLAAELEALLASDELPDEDENESGSGLRFSADEELPPLHDGNFGVPETAELALDHLDASTAAITAHVERLPTAMRFTDLELESLDDLPALTISASTDEPVRSGTESRKVSAPDSWALMDDDVLVAESAQSDATDFGIEKLSAADFLAPDVEQVAPEIEPLMSLELVSIEEAIAPKQFVRASDHEMVLDELGSALSRLVLLGAAVNGVDSVNSFLAALPSGSRLTFLHTQHLAGQQSDAELLERLVAHSPLPVRLAAQGTRAVQGEVLVVPAGQQVLLRRDGKIELQAMASDQSQSPSIDASFTMAANAFGRDAVAIVFAGRANDAVAGAQAIHDRGGQVWVESSSGEHFADMVSGIFAERLVSFSGTPHELAARLIEVFP